MVGGMVEEGRVRCGDGGSDACSVVGGIEERVVGVVRIESRVGVGVVGRKAAFLPSSKLGFLLDTAGFS